MQKNSHQFMAVFFDFFIGIILSAGFAAAKESVPSLFVFGDSLVDVGNNNYLPLSILKGNYPHHGIDFPTGNPTGRFCNGKNGADLLAEKLGLPSPPPHLSIEKEVNKSAILTGLNFASGGATILDGLGQTLGQSISISQQVQDYIPIYEELVNHLQSTVAQKRLSKSIFLIVIGSNDLSLYIESSELCKTTNPRQFTGSMATKLKEQLKILYGHGARKLLVVGISKLGCTPSQRTKDTSRGCNEEANKLCTMFNKALNTMLEQLQQEFHGSLSYSFFDSYKVMHDIYADSTVYGFTDVTSACCGSGKLNAELPCFPTSNICRNRTEYFFWDRFGHPTEATNRVLVNHVFGGSSQYSYPINVEQLVSI